MNQRLYLLVIALLAWAGSGTASAHSYFGTITSCSGTCDSFAALAIGSTINGTFQIDTTPGGTFDDADIVDIQFEIVNPALPIIEPVGDPTIDNPLILKSSLGSLASNGSAGTSDASNNITSGQILLEFLQPPFSTNGAFIVIDPVSSVGQICLFYEVAGCIPGATVAAQFEGLFAFLDFDGDTVGDSSDNCLSTANANQLDTDGDGYGNACDSDLNNDCVINVIDLGIFKTAMFTSDEDSDFNGDGIVDETDLAVLRFQFFKSITTFTLTTGLCGDP